jgi:hypothetical protein
VKLDCLKNETGLDSCLTASFNTGGAELVQATVLILKVFWTGNNNKLLPEQILAANVIHNQFRRADKGVHIGTWAYG